MKYSQIRAFHAVAQAGSFTAASERLCLTQPAVTLQIKALEEENKINLLHRNGRQVRLTAAGEQLYALTQKMFVSVSEIDDFFGATGALIRGQLSIGADSPLHVMELLAKFQRRYPHIDVSISLGNSKAILNGILLYENDVGIMANYKEDSRIASFLYSSSPLVVLVARDHEWAKRQFISINSLKNTATICREEGSSTRACFENALKRIHASPNYTLELGSREAIREAVARNVGISVMQQSEVGNDERLVSLHISDADVELKEYIVCLKERLNSRSVSSFLLLSGVLPNTDKRML